MFALRFAAIVEPLVVAVFGYGTTADMPLNRAHRNEVGQSVNQFNSNPERFRRRILASPAILSLDDAFR